MSHKIADLVKQMATTSGLTDFTLAAAAVAEFESFDYLSVGDTTWYRAKNGTEHEVGLGTKASGVLQRTTVLSSSNAGAKVNFSAPPELICTVPASKINTAKVPAFSAYRSTAQAIPANAWTKLLFDTEEYDDTNAYDNTTNFRFQPDVPGIYLISGAWGGGSSVAGLFAGIYKNGVLYKRGNFIATNGGTAVAVAHVKMNGGSDYVELWGQIATAQNTGTGPEYTYFQGTLLTRT